MHTFIAGTKAKASEVNENFEEVLNNTILSNLQDTYVNNKIHGIIEDDGITGTPVYDKENSSVVYCDVAKNYVAGGNILDACEGTSVDTNIWTTIGSPITEADGVIVLNMNSSSGVDMSITSNGSSGLNMNSGITYVVLRLEVNAYNNTYSNTYITITNGSTEVDVCRIRDKNSVFLLKVDASTNLANLYEHTGINTWNQIATNVDISTVTTNKYLKLRNYISRGNTPRSLLHVKKICYYNTDADSELITLKKDQYENAEQCWISGQVIQNGATSPTAEGSSNNGTNWYSGNKGQEIDLTTNSTELKGKLIVKTNNNLTPDEINFMTMIVRQ